jgi:hypothetical protein
VLLDVHTSPQKKTIASHHTPLKREHTSNGATGEDHTDMQDEQGVSSIDRKNLRTNLKLTTKGRKGGAMKERIWRMQ